MTIRKLTHEEQLCFLNELADLLERYNVEIEAEEHIVGYCYGPPTVTISDAYGYELLRGHALYDHKDVRNQIEQLESE